MRCYPPRIRFGRTKILLLGVLLGFIVQPIRHADGAAMSTENQRGNINPVETTAQIECITPDGRWSAITNGRTVDPHAPASILDENTISCPLREGETTFIIALPKNALRDRFTFVNENAAACGEFKVAVSNWRLRADSPKWTEVDGIVPFAHKRLFNLSMLGVETKFVRLSFRVESMRENGYGDGVRMSNTFCASALAGAINSNFAKLHGQRGEVLTSFPSVSAAPLLPRLNE